MARGTIILNESASSGARIAAKIEWEATVDTLANASKNVTAKIYVRKYNPEITLTIPTSGTWSFALTINGSRVTGTAKKDVLLDWVLIKTHTVGSIAHNSDGNKSITISGSVTAPSGTGFAGHTSSGSGTAKLDSIARASAITAAADITLGNFCSVKWTPASASFRYKLKFSMGTWSYTTGVLHPNTTGEYTYTGYAIPLSVASQIPNTRIGDMTVTLYTYSDSGATSQIGTVDTDTFKVTVPDNINTKPVVSMGLSPVGALPSEFAGLYIQGLTKVKATLSAEGKFGASINTYLMRVDGVYHDADDAYTSSYFAVAGKRTVYGYATDYRGHTGEKLQEIDVIAYSAPKLEGAAAVRCDQDGNASESGTYLKITGKRSYSPVISGGAQKNFCAIQYRYTQDGVSWSPWVTILAPESLERDDVTTDPLLGGVLSTQLSYVVHVMAVDSIGRFAETFIDIPTERVYWHRDGARNALGLGKYNERDNAVDSAWDFYMNDNRITGLPMPVDDTDAVPKAYVAPADIKMRGYPSTTGWYKIGKITADMCAVVTLFVGGVFQNNQSSPSVVDIATQCDIARAFTRLPSIAENQISKIGIIKESSLVFGVYAYYNSSQENPVDIIAHPAMGTFQGEDWTVSTVSESNMAAVVSLMA